MLAFNLINHINLAVIQTPVSLKCMLIESINMVGIPSCLITTGRKLVFFDIASMTPRLGAVCVLRAHYNRGLMSTAPRQLTADCAHCTCHQVQSACCLCFALCCLDSRLSRLMT